MAVEVSRDGRVRRGPDPGRRDARTIRWVKDDETRDFAAPGGLPLRWSTCGDEPDGPGLLSVDGVFLAGGRAVGCLSIHEFRLPPMAGGNADAFREWVARMRMPGADDAAGAMCDGWRPDEVRDAGALVWFSRLWVEPAHARGGVWPTVNAFLDARYGRGGPEAGALLLLEPFPLEYENAFVEGDGVPQEPLEERRAAMRRLYAARLGAGALEGSDWMWRALDPRLPPPRPSPQGCAPPGLR